MLRHPMVAHRPALVDTGLILELTTVYSAHQATPAVEAPRVSAQEALGPNLEPHLVHHTLLALTRIQVPERRPLNHVLLATTLMETRSAQGARKAMNVMARIRLPARVEPTAQLVLPPPLAVKTIKTVPHGATTVAMVNV